MEKGFRMVRCPGCGIRMRIKISEEQYGRTLEVTCPKCETKGRVIIPIPPPEESVHTTEPKQKEHILDDIMEMFGSFHTNKETKIN